MTTRHVRKPNPIRQHRPAIRRRIQRANFRSKRWLLVFPVIFFGWLAISYVTIAHGMKPPTQMILGAKGVEVLDRNGKLLFEFSDEPNSSTITPLSEISPHIVNATIATEDANFWKNPGVNLKGLARAAYENVAFWENGGFFKGSGGSSLSQQLAKNLYIEPEDRSKRSPFRKVKETIVALELTRKYSKEQIMEWYLSGVYYGHGAYGIESAAYRYFNKSPKDLTLAEATLIAGIPRAPSVYDPITNIEAAKERQAEVLNLMVRHGLLPRADADTAMKQPLALKEGRSPSGEIADYMAPHFAAYVRELAPTLLGKGNVPERIRITTTIDRTLQTKAEEIVTRELDRFEKSVGATNGGLVAMDPRTGEILAMVGSHDFEREDISGQVNNVLSPNQPGSTMKAITYLAAFIKGWSPATIVVDEPLKMNDSEAPYTLQNADKRYRGSIPVRQALGSSLNVPAVKALEYASLPEVIKLAKQMGLTTIGPASNYGPAFTLGGVDVNLLDMTLVYSVLANQGQMSGMDSVLDLDDGNRKVDPVAVLKIESVDGKTLWRPKARNERVVAANAAYLVTHVLKDDAARVSMFGANSPLKLGNRPAAVKSGSSDNTRDAWAIGYTTTLVTGVWVGNANNQPMPAATSTNTAGPIWNAFMTAAHDGKPMQDFPVPEGVERARVCATTGQAPASGCPSIIEEVFMSNRTPQGAKIPTPGPTSAQPTQRPQTAPPTQQLPPTPMPSPIPFATPLVQPTQPRQPTPAAPPTQRAQPTQYVPPTLVPAPTQNIPNTPIPQNPSGVPATPTRVATPNNSGPSN